MQTCTVEEDFFCRFLDIHLDLFSRPTGDFCVAVCIGIWVITHRSVEVRGRMSSLLVLHSMVVLKNLGK